MNTLVRLLLVVSLIGLAACEEEGPMERAGEKMDEAMESTAESAEKLGDDIEEAMESTAESAEKLGDDIEEAPEE